MTWPKPGIAEVAVPAPTARHTNRVKAGTLPVAIGPAEKSAEKSAEDRAAGRSPEKIRVEVLDPAADKATAAAAAAIKAAKPTTGSKLGAASRQRVVVRIVRTDGVSSRAPVSVEVDYTGFRDAFGGDWAARLRLFALPECALATPERTECRATPIATKNDPKSGKLVADVEAAPAGSLYAVQPTADGPTGDFGATPLAASATWAAGTSSGDFGWNYPMRVPPSLGGPAPSLALSYSSQSVDGRTATTNNQPSWIGQGFDYWPGYIERKYKACADDTTGSINPTKTGDLCWGTDNATLSLNGKGSEIVSDDGAKGWHLRSDDGSRIERVFGTVENGDQDREYWKVTTTDGTQYFFGSQARDADYSSTWTVPVFGNHTGEPCNNGSNYDASWCQQAWRWNLDKVIDRNGNIMALWYTPEWNYYGRNESNTKSTPYVRGGTVSKIEYGMREGTEWAPAYVYFETADRCRFDTFEQCEGHPEHWPDTPWERWCGNASCSHHSPTFWTQKRLKTVLTRVCRPGDCEPGARRGSRRDFYYDVDSWTLRHEYPRNNDGTKEGMWLAGIAHKGHVNGEITLPEVNFEGVQLHNRIDAAAGPTMNWWRVKTIYSETGGKLDVAYSSTECGPGNMPAAPDSNTKRCSPTLITQPDGTNYTDWFHKYVVTRVEESGNLAGDTSASARTSYEYDGVPAWHYDDDDGIVPEKRKTWGHWRGYGKVRAIKGNGSDGKQTKTETTYFRGMHGDKLANGSARTAKVKDSEGFEVDDHEALVGTVRESMTYDGATVISGKINDGWKYLTATRTRPWQVARSYLTGSAKERTRTALENGQWRRTELQTTFDDADSKYTFKTGLPIRANDLGDIADPNDNRCGRTDYVQNTSAWLMSFASRAEVVGKDCATTPTRPDDVLADARSSYDGAGFGTAPSKGNITRSEEISGWANGNGTYFTKARAEHDAYGRPVKTRDAKGELTTTEYTPAANGPVTSTKATNPLGHVTTTTLEPAWGTKTAIVDANGKKAQAELDPLGRTTKVWAPGRANTETPNATFEYLIRQDGPNVVTTRKLLPDGTYLPALALYDGLLRPRQTQSSGPGATVVSDTIYNSTGAAYKKNGPFTTRGEPVTDLVMPDEATLPAQTITEFDGAGRATAEIFKRQNVEQWRTSTRYGGDRVHVTPPSGGTPTTTVSNARGKTVELRQYSSTGPAPTFDTTKYGYDRADRLTSVTDTAGNSWKYHYDIRGRKIKSEDPDKGATTYRYNDAGELTSTTDARNTTLAYVYDKLGRKTELRDNSATGALRAKWTFDTLAKGKPTSSTRYLGSNAYVNEVTGYDDGYRPTSSRVTIPTVEGKLGRAYETQSTYHLDGSPATTKLPAIGNLPAETLKFGYDTFGMASTLLADTQAGPVSYARASGYTPFGELQQLTLGEDGNSAWLSYEYEEGTRRLAHMVTERDTMLARIQGDVRYSHDPAGNVLKIADTPGVDTNEPADTQCFKYDHLRRLTEAWTPGNHDCAPAPSTGALGGPAQYWHSYGYDKTGNRTTETQHGVGGDRTRTYTYPAAGQARPHGLTSVTTKKPDGSSTLDTYQYDAIGNTISRKLAGADQRHEYDPEGRVTKVTNPDGKTTQMVYAADGDRLLRRDSTGTTLYVAGMELRLDKATDSVTGTRFYSHAGKSVAVRTGSTVTWMSSDHHGTGHLAITAGTLEVARRRTAPFGDERGTRPAWPDEHGFVNGVKDPTGLTHLGAREYDPTTGRFTTVDPIIDHNDPQQMNGYAYGRNNPATYSDPTGLREAEDLYGRGSGRYGEPLPQINYDRSQKNYGFVTDSRGRTHRFSLNDTKVTQENLDVRDFLNRSGNRASTNGSLIENAPRSGTLYIANDENWKTAQTQGRVADFLKLEFRDGRLIRVTTADLYEPVAEADSRKISGHMQAKQSQADEIIVRKKGGMTRVEAQELLQQTRDQTFESRRVISGPSTGTAGENLDMTSSRGRGPQDPPEGSGGGPDRGNDNGGSGCTPVTAHSGGTCGPGSGGLPWITTPGGVRAPSGVRVPIPLCPLPTMCF